MDPKGDDKDRTGSPLDTCTRSSSSERSEIDGEDVWMWVWMWMGCTVPGWVTVGILRANLCTF